MKFAWWGWGSQLLYCKFIFCLEHCVYSWNHSKVECLSEGIGGWGLVLFLSNLSAREINAYMLQQWKSWIFCFPISESLGGSPLHWCPWTCHGLGPCATSQSHATSQLTTYLCVTAVWLLERNSNHREKKVEHELLAAFVFHKTHLAQDDCCSWKLRCFHWQRTRRLRFTTKSSLGLQTQAWNVNTM